MHCGIAFSSLLLAFIFRCSLSFQWHSFCLVISAYYQEYTATWGTDVLATSVSCQYEWFLQGCSGLRENLVHEKLSAVSMYGTNCHDLFCCLCHHWDPLPCTHPAAASFQNNKKKEEALPGMNIVKEGSEGLRWSKWEITHARKKW